jgi:hypothetical protein
VVHIKVDLADSSGHNNELSGQVTGGGVLDQLNDYYFVKKGYFSVIKAHKSLKRIKGHCLHVN